CTRPPENAVACGLPRVHGWEYDPARLGTPKEERTLRARWLVTAVSIASLAVGVSACGGGGGGGGPTAKISGTSLTVYSSLPEQGASGDQAKAIENGAKLAVQSRGGKVGKYSITYNPLDA